MAVLTLPAASGSSTWRGDPAAAFIARPGKVVSDLRPCRAARRIDAPAGHRARRHGARAARAEVLALAEKLSAPMVLTLKAKAGLERDNPFQVGQTGLIGDPAARHASTAATCC